MPSLDISSVAQKIGSHAVGRTDTTTPADARQALRDMRADLVAKDGKIASGYLSINTRKDGTVNLETRGRHELGSWHSDKKDATNIVKDLIKKGYGKELSAASEKALESELNAYLKKTEDRFGTHSFVNLIDLLESSIPAGAVLEGGIPAGGGTESEAKVKSDVRLKAHFRLELKSEGCSPQAKSQFQTITDSVRSETALHFQHILSPGVSRAGNIAAHTQVVGDADGSMCRTVLSAINSGHMELAEPELKLLAEVMDAEAKGDPKSFQKDRSIAGKLDRIVAKATFKPGHHNLVFIGDILHDRFSNNKVAMDKLIRCLHAQGAVFVTGNHDVYGEVNRLGIYQNDYNFLLNALVRSDKRENITDEERRASASKNLAPPESFEKIKVQNGFYGAKQLDKAASDQLLKDCFTNAYFESNTNALYTHNGFEHSGVDNVYLTAFGFLRADNAEQLAEKMNACDFNSKGIGLEQIKKDIRDFSSWLPPKNLGIGKDGFISKTSFRPDDSRMQTNQLGPAGKTRDGAPVKIIHGHNADHGTHGNVENLNARSPEGFSPVAKMIS